MLNLEWRSTAECKCSSSAFAEGDAVVWCSQTYVVEVVLLRFVGGVQIGASSHGRPGSTASTRLEVPK